VPAVAAADNLGKSKCASLQELEATRPEVRTPPRLWSMLWSAPGPDYARVTGSTWSSPPHHYDRAVPRVAELRATNCLDIQASRRHACEAGSEQAPSPDSKR